MVEQKPALLRAPSRACEYRAADANTMPRPALLILRVFVSSSLSVIHPAHLQAFHSARKVSSRVLILQIESQSLSKMGLKIRLV